MAAITPAHLLPDLIDGDLAQLPALASRHGVRLLVLFGSTVKGRRHPESDLDLAVLFDREPVDETWLTEESDLLADLERVL